MLPGDGLQLSLKMKRWEGVDAILHCFTHGRMAQNAANLRRLHILSIHANDMLLSCCLCSDFCQDGLLVAAHRQAAKQASKAVSTSEHQKLNPNPALISTHRSTDKSAHWSLS